MGDVIVFDYPVDPSKTFVKRLVGLPGDTLSMRDGTLLHNGQPMVEQYVVHSDPGADPATDEFRWQRSHLVNTAMAASDGYNPSRNNWGPLVVPAHHFFVLGDNRDNSADSRYWGFVSDTLLRGTPLIVYYSFTPDSATAVPWLKNIRWARIGRTVH